MAVAGLILYLCPLLFPFSPPHQLENITASWCENRIHHDDPQNTSYFHLCHLQAMPPGSPALGT